MSQKKNQTTGKPEQFALTKCFDESATSKIEKW